MRSRLEATFAAMLDVASSENADIAWSYEPRAYAGVQGQYLPDFEIRVRGKVPVFIEVKPTIELAYLVMPRMAVIWESEPAALLMVVVAGGLYFMADPETRRFVPQRMEWAA